MSGVEGRKGIGTRFQKYYFENQADSSDRVDWTDVSFQGTICRHALLREVYIRDVYVGTFNAKR